MSDKPTIPGGYLSFPHRLLKRACDLNISGSQWKALTCAIYQGLGNKSNQQKGSFQFGLSVLQKRGKMSKAEAWRSRDFLIKEGFIIETKAPDIDHAKAGEYRLNLESYEDGTVTKPERLRKRKHDAGDTLSDTQSSEKPFPNGNSPRYETGTVTVTKREPNRYETGTEDNCIDNTTDRNLITDSDPPRPLPQGERPERQKAAAPGPAAKSFFPFSPNLPKSEKQKPDPEAYLQHFREELAPENKLLGVRRAELVEILENVNEKRLQAKFFSMVEKCKGERPPEKLKEPSKLFWAIMLAAVNAVNGKKETAKTG